MPERKLVAVREVSIGEAYVRARQTMVWGVTSGVVGTVLVRNRYAAGYTNGVVALVGWGLVVRMVYLILQSKPVFFKGGKTLNDVRVAVLGAMAELGVYLWLKPGAMWEISKYMVPAVLLLGLSFYL